MAKVRAPAEIEIAALKQKAVAQSNLMQAGPGTPWEDRGSLGMIPAFFATCFKAITAPGQLWDQIRRPETTSDATSFAFGCGIVAGVSWVVHSLAWDLVYSGYALSDGVPPLRVKSDPRFIVDWQTWGIGAALQMICAIAGTWLLLKLANATYQKLLPHGFATRIPQVLTYNVLAYSLGVVLLTLIPCFGWALALVWLMVLFIYASKRRLALGGGTAAVSGVITFLTVTVVAFLIYFAGAYIWANAYGSSVTFIQPIKTPGAATP
jgi:hypothetical protein